MSANPASHHVAACWPNLWRAGLISVVGRPATSYDLRTTNMEARMKDLKRRAIAYAKKKKARK